MKTRTDTLLLILTALFVGGLAVVAGAISFAHMRELATHHDQLGWKSLAFPVSVDGLEIVASLYLVAQRRAGRHTGWIPWVTLIVGTVASLAANVAVGGADPIGKALAGWPALSMLVSVKLLFSMFDHEAVGQRATVPDGQRLSRIVRTNEQEDPASSRTVPTKRTTTPVLSDANPDGLSSNTSTSGTSASDGKAVARTGKGGHAAPLDIHTVTPLIPAACEAVATLVDDRRSLSRDNLADAMRNDGHGISNERASLLLKITKAEREQSPVGSDAGPASSRKLGVAVGGAVGSPAAHGRRQTSGRRLMGAMVRGSAGDPILRAW